MQVLEPGADGVFRHVEGLCHYLLAAGHRVDLAYSSRRGSDRLHALVAEVARAGGATLDLATGNAPAVADLRAFRQLRALVRQIQPDLVHAHSSKAGALVRSLRLVGITQPLIYTPHAYYGMSQSPGMKTRFFNAVERGLGRIGWSIHVSEDEGAWARANLGLAGGRCRVVPNSVDTAVFTPGTDADRARFREEFGWPTNAIVLGAVGRLSPQKDPLTLYRAMVAVMARQPRLHLAQVGQGELAPALAQILRDSGQSARVRRLEYLPDTTKFYRGLDGFMATSRYEGLPIAVLEAMAADLPLLLSEVPGHRGFGQWGLSCLRYAPAGDVSAWTTLVDAWVRERADGEDRSKLRSNHREIADAKFSLRAGYGQLMALYQTVLSAR